MRSPGVNCMSIKRKIKIYDVVNKRLIKECASKSEAMEYAGVKGLDRYLKHKYRCHKNKLGIVITFR